MFSWGPAFVNGQTLSLDDAIKAAGTNNRSILTAELERKKVVDEVYIAPPLADIFVHRPRIAASKGEQIDRFGTYVQARLADIRPSLPPRGTFR
jgi:hypothetical protein